MIPDQKKQQNPKGKGRRYFVYLDPSFFPVDQDPEQAEQTVRVVRAALKDAGFTIDQSKQGVVLSQRQIKAILPKDYETNPVAKERFVARFADRKSYKMCVTVPDDCTTRIDQVLPPSTHKAARGFQSSDANLSAFFGTRLPDAVVYRSIK